MKSVIIFILGIYVLTSCSDKEELIGLWDDNIKLSTKNVDFKAQTDSVTITTEGDWWWIDCVSFEDSIYTYYDREDIDLESESYSINEELFAIERRDKNTLFVKINENITGKVREMNISLEAGDYFDSVTIEQAGN